MRSQLRQLLRAYADRRSPWGPPWWIYGVAFGTVNLVRQAAIILSGADVPQSVRVASYVATALAVIVATNGVAVAMRRLGSATEGQQRELAPMWPLRRPDGRRDVPAASPGEGDHRAMNQHRHEQAATSSTWAPWWVYVSVIVGGNYLRRTTTPDASTPAARLAVALAVSVALFVVITIVYRASVRRDDSRSA